MNLYERVGWKIRSARRKKGYTQKDLAKKIGCSVSMIGGVETGTRRVTLAFLDKVATALDKDPMYFIENRDTREERKRI